MHETHQHHPEPVGKETGQPPAKPKTFWRWLWWFIWEDNSVWSWIANIVLAFVIIKFLVYPALGFALGTTHPIVAVVSGSMEHDTAFDSWWSGPNCCDSKGCTSQRALYDRYNITQAEFAQFRFPNGFNKGDLMVLAAPKNLELGDIVVFGVQGLSDPVIHRAVLFTDGTINTKGDHNCGVGSFEHDIPQDALVGKAVLRVPYLGWVKLAFVNLINLILGRN
jgi:hypothetical protein